MTDIIAMAREAGFESNSLGMTYTSGRLPELLERFADLVRADERDRATRENAYVLAEREACAKMCDEASDKALALQSGRQDDLGSIILRHHAVAHQADAAAIRARGQA
jgi:hypothetical protein